MTASARPAAECPQCGRRWDKLGPQGYECRRCGLVLSRDELAATVAHATRNGSELVESTQAEPEVYFVKGFAAKRMADRLREDTHFATGGGRLYAYSQGCYRLGGEEHVRSRVAEALGDRWTKRYADEVVTFLRDTSPRLLERPPLDTVNVLNGLLDLDSGRLEEHTPDFLCPVQLNARFDPKAVGPTIERFIGEVFPGDAAAVAYELPGYLMAPDTSFQRAVMLLGGGGNGKSTYLGLLEVLLGGAANVSAVTLQALDKNRFSAAELYGKLANIVADLDAEAVRSSATFKAIVGGDTITAERKYGAPFTFKPYARLLFSANEAPPSFDTSYAYFRRWLIVPFEAVFQGDRKDKHLLAKLTTPAELSGLLNRALEGLQRLRRQGEFSHSKSLESAAQSFRTDVDSAAAFVAEECVLVPSYRARQADIYAAYKEWCDRVNRSPLSARRFNPRVQSLLPDPQDALVTVDGWPTWKGIGLRADVGREQLEGEEPGNVHVGHCQRCKAWTYLRGQLCSTCEESGG